MHRWIGVAVDKGRKNVVGGGVHRSGERLIEGEGCRVGWTWSGVVDNEWDE